MSELVCQGAEMICPFGSSLSTLNVVPTGDVLVEGSPVATIMDFQPIDDISSFGMCSSLANPAVAAATAAALGVLTPAPCVPNTVSPWEPGSQSVVIGGQPALDDACTCACVWGGVIEIAFAGQDVASD